MKQQNISFFLLLTLGAALPYLLYGFDYLPILDDYIQYGSYPLYENVSYVYLTIGTLATRPLAGLLDPVFWGLFRQTPGAALFLITLLHLLSAWLFYKTACRFQVTLSPLFFIIYLFAPLGMEGRYWLSAATRLITGLFFASLSLWCLALFFTKKQSVSALFFFALLQLISFGFYESVTVFSALCALFLFAASFMQSKNRKLLFVPLITGLQLAFMLLYYYFFRNLGSLGSRAGSISFLKVLPNFVEVLRQVQEMFSHSATLKGSLWGLQLLLSGTFWGICLLLFAIGISFLLSRRGTREKLAGRQKPLLLLGCGCLLFFAPLLPQALAETVWVTNRSLFVPLIGFALILEGFMSMFHKKHLQKILIFFACLLFLTANVNEYHLYRQVGMVDNAILNQVISEMDDMVLEGKKNLQVVLPKPVKIEQNAFYKDHIASVFSSDWALTGALRAKTKKLTIRRAEPVLAGSETDKAAQMIVVDCLPCALS